MLWVFPARFVNFRLLCPRFTPWRLVCAILSLRARVLRVPGGSLATASELYLKAARAAVHILST